ncbi:MAG TPA: hypothetical protein VN758_04605 [Solirubrobacterales bacterium]|nr:hypothetical protein [Solirubrobacterales bacterium]
MAPAAQGATRYLINGTPVTASEAVKGISGGLLLLIPELSTTLKCNLETLEGTISIEGKSDRTSTYTKCSVAGSTCEVAEPIVVKAKGELLAHGAGIYEVLKPLEGEAFTLLKFKGAGCTLPGEVKMSGTFAALVESGEGTTHQTFFSPTINELICKIISPCGVKFGINTATIEGQSLPKLNGVNKGKLWGVAIMPEFTVGSKPLDVVLQEHKLTSESVKAEGGTATISVPSYLGFGFVIACNQSSGSGTLEKLGRGSAIFNFKECVLTDGKGIIQKGCTVESVKAETSFLANVSEGSPFLVFSPPSGEAKDSIIRFTVNGESCLLLTGERVIRGTTIGLAKEGEAITQGVTFLKSAGLTYGVDSAYLETTVGLSLSGVSAGMKWGMR